MLVQGIRRIKLERFTQEEPYLAGEFTEVPDVAPETPEVEALSKNVQGLFSRIIDLAPYLPAELELAVANVDTPGELTYLIALDDAAPDCREAGAARGGERRGAPPPPVGDPEPRARVLRARREDPVAGAVRDGDVPARVLPPPAAQGDPGGARRRRRRPGRARGAEAPARRGRPARRGGPRRPAGSSTGCRGYRRRPRSTASSVRTSTGSCRCPGTSRPRTTSTCAARDESSTRITTTSRR